MYLVDTSVWIDYLREKSNEAVRLFGEILDNRTPFGITGLIFQEVLQGARGEDDFETLAEYLGSQRFYHPVDPVHTHQEAARLYFRCRRNGLTIRSSNDCLLARIAIEHGLILLHNDRDFSRIAQVESDLRQENGIP